MSNTQTYRALVVDDEAIVRQGAMRALCRWGFLCEAAPNGTAAYEMAKQNRYDVVVTDLRMPEANGHQLAIDLLAMPQRPAVVVLTGVAEPRLANDLRIRGVDEILFKPIEYDLLAKKTRGIVDQHILAAQQINTATLEAGDSTTSPEITEHVQHATACSDVSHLPHEANAIPMASAIPQQSAKAGFKLTAADLARAVKTDPAFATEIVRFAKQKHFSSNQTIGDAQQATMAIKKATAIRAVLIFAGGIVLGWMLSWVSIALFR